MFIPFEVEHEPHDAQRQPWLVYALLLTHVLVFGYTGLAADEATRTDLFYRFGLSRFDYRWWACLSCTFLHAGVLHLAGNGAFLWLYGSALEKLVGTPRFALLYVLGAFLSAHLHLLTVTPLFADEPCIGASGAISAVLGCFFVMLPHAKLRCLFFSVISFRPLVVLAPAWLILGLWFAGQLGYTLGVAGDLPGIAFWAHAAGFVAGAVLGTWFNHERGRQVREWSAATSQALESAWTACRAGDLDAATAALTALPAVHPDAQLTQRLIAGLIAARREPATAAPALLRVAGAARDYRDEGALLSVYLELVRTVPPAQIPPAVHRDAGFAALAHHADALALWAFHQSLGHGVTARWEQLVPAIANLLGTRCGRPDLAAAVAALAAARPPA